MNTTLPDRYEAFEAALSERDRRNVRRQVAACEAEPTDDRATMWKRLACSLAAMTDRPPKTTGTRAVQFFSADGEYQVQLFTLEDPRNGTVLVYCPDTLAAALAEGIISGPVHEDGKQSFYQVADLPGINLEIEVLSASKTVDAPDYYRHLLGWNRRALRMTLATKSGRAQVDACEAVCRLAARQASGARAGTAQPARGDA